MPFWGLFPVVPSRYPTQLSDGHAVRTNRLSTGKETGQTHWRWGIPSVQQHDSAR